MSHLSNDDRLVDVIGKTGEIYYLDMVLLLPPAFISRAMIVLRVSAPGTDDGLILVHQRALKRRVIPTRTRDDEDGARHYALQSVRL
jgi:hypothetical protein